MTRTRSLFAALATLPIAACVVGPDYHAPVTPKVEGYQSAPLPPATATADTEGGAAIRLTQGADPEARWWTVYGSADIDALVDQALKANPDLKSAQAALKAAEEAYFAQRAAIWPTVSAGYNLQRQKTAAVEASPLASNAETFTLHTTQLSIAYAPDVFGGLKRQAESAEAQAEAARFQARAAYVTLTANVVQAAVQEAALKDQLEATRALIADGRTQLDLMRRQKELGEISGADVAAQETAIAQLEQNLPPLERQIGQQQDLLADLTGRYPSQVPDSPLTLSKLSLPAELPVSLPSAVVAHRPDIQAAAANLHVASANVGVAVAARLPSFTLSAAAGGAGTDLSNLFTHGDEFWSLGLDAAQTVFDGGALKHKQKAAEALLDQAEAQYRSTVLSAFQNVADCLAALQADSRTLAAAAAAERSARTSVDLAQKQQEAGQTSSLAVLAARQAWRQARLVRLQAEAARYADTVALYQAMGGDGWRQAAWKAEQ
ncbi:efflux transporter outer membrane subunit [Phenylobacterium montanum]|uniref:Efflux transporter outer membrane subunit n=1 Tax=Phenylobacterium montanum TaxID=2823693 RepID=A0A975FV02_9CAUL|nr:efflux transporter outer membrane subunit [Caulobacter sp. S6]QUD85978.1 efflux transporter outer membrane subunit [Caulobacter sp. S6]